MADLILLLQLLVLLGIANGSPIFAKALLKDRFSAPLDGGIKLLDGRPVFGASKTVRGIVVSVGCTTLAAWLLGFEGLTGASIAAGSMAGDLASSFLKRRLGLPVHAQALGLDQIPEALLPLLLIQSRLGLSALDLAVLVAAFVILELVLSRLLYNLHIRDRPY